MICPICETAIDAQNVIIATCWEYLFFCFGQSHIVRHRCQNCDLIFGPIETINMDPKALSDIYINLYQHYSEAYNTADYFNFFHLNPSPNLTGKVYLNYACGTTPKYIENIREQGYNLIGVDSSIISENEYLFKTLESCPYRKFNGILSHNFIEHIQNPVQWFKMANGLLSVGDIMLHSTGCIGYTLEGTPFHLYFHSLKSLHRLAQKTGFLLIKYKKFKIQPIDTLDKQNVIESNYRPNERLCYDEGVYFIFKKIKNI